MRDYCKTFDNKPASTEDFKAIVEKTHAREGWISTATTRWIGSFNQYVYAWESRSTTSCFGGGYSDGKSHIKGRNHTLRRAGYLEGCHTTLRAHGRQNGPPWDLTATATRASHWSHRAGKNRPRLINDYEIYSRM